MTFFGRVLHDKVANSTCKANLRIFFPAKKTNVTPKHKKKRHFLRDISSKTNMTMENLLFEDAFPIESGDYQCHVSFQGCISLNSTRPNSCKTITLVIFFIHQRHQREKNVTFSKVNWAFWMDRQQSTIHNPRWKLEMFHVILFEHREKPHAGWPRGDLIISRNRMTQAL